MRLITLFLVFMLCSPTFAHFPLNTTFKVFQFPDSHVPLMDGDAADWSERVSQISTLLPRRGAGR